MCITNRRYAIGPGHCALHVSTVRAALSGLRTRLWRAMALESPQRHGIRGKVHRRGTATQETNSFAAFHFVPPFSTSFALSRAPRDNPVVARPEISDSDSSHVLCDSSLQSVDQPPVYPRLQRGAIRHDASARFSGNAQKPT